MNLDFHLHTNFSDGILSPEKLVEKVHQNGVDFFSITDHDCLEGIPSAQKTAESFGMTLIPGVEINTDWKDGEVHILGYGFNPESPPFQKKLEEQRFYRLQRLKAMIEKLQSIGLDLEESRVLEIAGNGAVGRPHLALALKEKNYVASVEEAFEKYLGYGRPGWVPRSKFTPQEAINLISGAGGIPVLAHPGRTKNVEIESLILSGLKGIECFYPKHTPDLTRKLLEIARKYDLVVTAGSDYHGINSWEKEPGMQVPEEVFLNLQKRLKEGALTRNE
ncbi:MAG: PHP domain-containing protein [Firmicutes bacterium]|nr:PHP domain-containing protein [Bacillota bacterium]